MTGITGIDQLDDMIATVRGVGDSAEYVQAMRDKLDEFTKGNIAAGQSPDGTKWPDRKRGGRRLVNAAKAVTTTIAGKSVVQRVTGVEAFHHYAAGDLPELQIIPVTVVMKLGNAIRAGLADVFTAKTRGGKRGFAYMRSRGMNPRAK